MTLFPYHALHREACTSLIASGSLLKHLETEILPEKLFFKSTVFFPFFRPQATLSSPACRFLPHHSQQGVCSLVWASLKNKHDAIQHWSEITGVHEIYAVTYFRELILMAAPTTVCPLKWCGRYVLGNMTFVIAVIYQRLGYCQSGSV